MSLLCSKLSDSNIICQNILKEAAYELSLLVKRLIACYDYKPLITYHGGLFHNAIYKDTFIESLCDYNVIKPAKHKKLAEDIIKTGGCLVSEYDPDKN